MFSITPTLLTASISVQSTLQYTLTTNSHQATFSTTFSYCGQPKNTVCQQFSIPNQGYLPCTNIILIQFRFQIAAFNQSTSFPSLLVQNSIHSSPPHTLIKCSKNCLSRSGEGPKFFPLQAGSVSYRYLKFRCSAL